jgi:hypothetical protein
MGVIPQLVGCGGHRYGRSKDFALGLSMRWVMQSVETCRPSGVVGVASAAATTARWSAVSEACSIISPYGPHPRCLRPRAELDNHAQGLGHLAPDQGSRVAPYSPATRLANGPLGCIQKDIDGMTRIVIIRVQTST